MLMSHIVRCALAPVLLAASAAGAAPAAEPPGHESAPVVNGAPSYGFPTVGMIFYDHMVCSGTLVGCRTVLTAAHCLCYDGAFTPPRLQVGDACRERPGLVDPAAKRVFFPHAGIFEVTDLVLHPGWGAPGGRYDLAILRLDRPVTGVRPSALHDAEPVPTRSEGTVAGFGRTSRDRADQGIQRAGRITTSKCGDDFVCWWLSEPLGPAGEDAGVCYHDSGGGVFVDRGEGPLLAGVVYSASNATCRPPSMSTATAVYAHRDWIAETAGADLGDGACGNLPPVGGPGTWTDGATGVVSESRPEALYTFTVPPGAGLLRVTLTATGTARPADVDLDLSVRHGRPPGPDAPPACTSRGPGGLEVCEVPAPAEGTWYAGIQRVRGDGRFQITVTRFDAAAAPGGPPDPEEPEEPPPAPSPGAPPDPPAGAWLASDELPGFEAKVRFHGGAAPVPGALEPRCVPGALCVSGAVGGRPELLLRVVGPRPNGFLWVQISRFTPSRAEVWLRQRSSGRIHHYELAPVGPANPGVPGLQDRRAFLP